MGYFYALFGFLYIDETFWSNDIEPAGENMCYTMIQCFTTVASLGPRSSGSVGDVLLRPTYAWAKRDIYYVRWIYDVTIFFIVNIICMKLIFGIIIDTFAELRDKKNSKDHDRFNKCFICNLESYVSEMMAKDDIIWVPTEKALCIQENNADMDNLNEKIEQIKSAIDSIHVKLTKLNH